ncbi:MAG: hypothetical protein AB7O50_02940 [Pseudolabrys sp.]
MSIAANLLLSGPAAAHVKWFCAFDVSGQPVTLANVLCPDFELLVGMSLLALMSGCLVEPTPVGAAILRALDRTTEWIRDNTEMLFRAGVGMFFVAIWAIGGILMTPELKTNSTIIGFIHIGIAAGVLSRRTMPLSGLGIMVIYAVAIWNYGVFHLADYPIFLGVALYLILTGLQRDLLGQRPIDVVRWAAGITLMWASIEKWAYPDWSYPLLAKHAALTLGFQPEFYMRAAGAIEFALAFALMWTPLVRRISAILLAAMFVGAVVQFGKIDFIGHSLIIVVLFAIVADRGRTHVELVRYPWLSPLGYAASLALFMAAYYAGHSALFGSSPVS